jgi:hypothetical protein
MPIIRSSTAVGVGASGSTFGAVLLVVVRPVDNWPHNDQQHCYHHALKVKPEADTEIVELLMGVRAHETC